jgi:hypothetical protein
MEFLTRVTLTTLVGCTLLHTTAGGPSWLRFSFQEIPEVCRRVSACRQREEDLGRRKTCFQTLTRRKQEIAADLAAGRLTLPRAAAQFRELSRHDELFARLVEELSPSGTKEEKLCRYVIDWAGAMLEEEPAKAQATARRLRAELDWRLRAGGPLVEP